MNRLIQTAFLLLSCYCPAQASFDLQVVDAGPFNYVTPGTYPVYITAKNLNNDYAVTTLEAHWQMDGGAVHSCTINDFLIWDVIYPGFLERFTHTDSMTFTTTGTYTLKVWTSMPEGEPDVNPSNDTALLTIHVVDYLPAKKMILYYGTHTMCIPCGEYGEAAVEEVLDSFPGMVYSISVMDGLIEPYNCPDGMHLNNVYVWPYTGHPAFLFDLFQFPYFYNVVPDNNYVFGSFWKSVPLRSDYKYPIEATVENLQMDTFTHVLNGEVHIKFYADFSDSLSVNVIITEDSIYDVQAGLPDSIYHRHIMRDMVDGLYGNTGVIPQTVSSGDEFVYSFSDSLSPDFNVKQLYVLGYVQHYSKDSMKCDVLNADREHVTNFGAVTSAAAVTHQELSAEIFPDPSDGNVTLSIYGATGEISWEIYDVLGKQTMQGNQPLQNQEMQLSLSSLPGGPYFIRIRSGRQSIVLKCFKD